MNCPYASTGSVALNPPANCPYLGGQGGGGFYVNNPVAEQEAWLEREDFRMLVRALSDLVDKISSGGDFIDSLKRFVEYHSPAKEANTNGVVR